MLTVSFWAMRGAKMSGRNSLVGLVEKILNGIHAVCIFTACVALIVLIVTFGWLVFGRYVLNVTPTWVEQLALLLICYIAFLGAAAGVRDESHLGVTLFRDMVPTGVQKAVIIVIDFIIAAFGVVMCLAGITLMQFGWDSLLPMLDIPESFRTLAITLCGGLIFILAGTRAVLRLLTFTQWEPISGQQES